MNIKLDENVHGDVLNALSALGHDVQSALQEGLAGRPDTEVAAAIKSEGRCLVTFDLDFANPRLFPPQDYFGLIVVRMRRATGARQVDLISRFLAGNPQVRGCLWVVEENRARDWTP